MSQLDNFTEQLKASGTRIGQQIQESPAYQQAQDRYESLSPSAQKLVGIVGAIFLLIVLLFYPLTKLSTSQESLALFQEKRDLIRDLFRTYREASSAPNIPVPPPAEQLRASIENAIARAELLPEQKLGVMSGTSEGRLIPASLVTAVFEVKLAKLNLKQIVDIGASLVGISESVKMKDMLINANAQDTRYYDVTYKLYSLNVPQPTPDLPPEPEPRNNRRNNQDSNP